MNGECMSNENQYILQTGKSEKRGCVFLIIRSQARKKRYKILEDNLRDLRAVIDIFFENHADAIAEKFGCGLMGARSLLCTAYAEMVEDGDV